jgi:hypothetical protein
MGLSISAAMAIVISTPIHRCFVGCCALADASPVIAVPSEKRNDLRRLIDRAFANTNIPQRSALSEVVDWSTRLIDLWERRTHALQIKHDGQITSV